MECTTQRQPIGFLWMESKRIDLNPPYQRESGVWSEEKSQLFIDSIINGFDIPKIYFHDRTDEEGPISYSVVDGKQRLNAIWEFLSGKFKLASDFKYTSKIPGQSEGNKFLPETGYKDFSEYQKEFFKSKSIDIVYIQRADEDDIEELFSRLNNGEPLNAAEKRNAIGGDMISLIRNLSKNSFFTQCLGFQNRRFSHYEVSAKLIRMELSEQNGTGEFCDLKKRFLDDLANKNKIMTEAEQTGLTRKVERNLKNLEKIFGAKDSLLSKQSYPQLYYGWVKHVMSNYAAENIHGLIHDFLESFQVKRASNFQLPEEERDPSLVEYGRLMQQGTNDLNSMLDRSRILTKFLLLDHPEIVLKDSTRHFTEEERFVLWINSGKECAECHSKLATLEDMEADHRHAWSKGGETSLSNAQALCVTCNRKKGSRA